VQAIIAASVAVTAVTARFLLRTRLSAGAVGALVVLVAGLAAIAAGAKPGVAQPLNPAAGAALLGSAAGLAAAAAYAAHRHSMAGDLALAAATGAAFGAVGIAARGLRIPHPLWSLVTTPAALAVGVFGVLGAVILPVALQRGSVTVSAAVMLTVETVVPAIVGVVVLGDRTRGHAGASLAVGGFIATTAGTIALAALVGPAATQRTAREPNQV
jgi:drug/metabolite transporter (DMT)-like permease